ncbi:MORN repeat-containing protein 3 isoform X2 [Bos taurus]|uniref:MORN repeat-containing protein 3 isoform X2 n=1 Tax=Bos taurus TaxID=9913 RepID=UPI000572E1CA|nr:MORN repeat-containing protein 3 isoform X2 [Bos taurus]
MFLTLWPHRSSQHAYIQVPAKVGAPVEGVGPEGPEEWTEAPGVRCQWRPLRGRVEGQRETRLCGKPVVWTEPWTKSQDAGVLSLALLLRGCVTLGKGTQVWKKNGAIYEGDWKSGKRDGYGTLSLPDQETGKYKRAYSGWWKGDKKCGYGIQFFGPKEYYEGDWCGNQRSGWGRMYYSNGDIYEGQWRNDKPEGEGMLRLKNGNRYEGNWQRGVKNGSGRFFHLDHGQLFEGFWVDDVAKCGTMIDFGRDEAPQPTQFPIPEVKILDPDGVLEEALAMFKKTKEEGD